LFELINKSKIAEKYKLGIGDWGLGIGPNPQYPIPNHQKIIKIGKK